ncbi:MAG TPA: hypothetical protein VK615_01235, partial [Candidatus Binatia bacterium]|nr:hypothetical protein [Candidatus Binatia bacterium]
MDVALQWLPLLVKKPVAYAFPHFKATGFLFVARATPKTWDMAETNAETMVSTWVGVVQYGGMMTITSPMGLVSTPRRAMASQTRAPTRSRNGKRSRV